MSRQVEASGRAPGGGSGHGSGAAAHGTVAVRALTPEEHERLRVATLVALRHMPYMAGILYNLRPVAAPGLGGTGTDRRWRLHVDPEVLAGQPDDVARRLLHEAGHLVRRHARRADALGVLDAERWNLAADLDVNADLASSQMAGLRVPDDWPRPQHRGLPTGRSAEEYYALLPETAAGDDDGAADGVGEPGDGGSAAPSGSVGQSCGSGAGGPELPSESGAAGGVLDDAGGVGDAEGDLLARETAVRVAAHVASNGRGSVPGGLSRWADATLAPPTIDWRSELSAAVRRATSHAAGKVDYTYRRPSRRRIPGVVLPSLQQPRPQIVTVLDTSGSMRHQMLRAALSEVEGVCRGAGLRGPDHRVMTFDAAVHSVRTVQSARDLDLRGGGGTDMRRGIEAALRLRPSPDVVIVMTDGFTPWPEVRPSRAKVVVVLIEGRRAAPRPPEWAHVVRVRADDVTSTT